jgi:hypothetical protein
MRNKNKQNKNSKHYSDVKEMANDTT